MLKIKPTAEAVMLTVVLMLLLGSLIIAIFVSDRTSITVTCPNGRSETIHHSADITCTDSDILVKDQ